MNNAMTMTPNKSTRPWYREPWPWILATGPFLVVIAGIATAWIAVKSNDGLVTDDYYLKGLSAGETIARSDAATRMGVEAALKVTADRISVQLTATDATFAPPPSLTVTISHPTRAGLDQTRVLARNGNAYGGELRLPASGHWLVMIEDDARQWRLLGNVVLPAAGEIHIGGPVHATHPAE